jgi:hypothetical protein
VVAVHGSVVIATRDGPRRPSSAASSQQTRRRLDSDTTPRLLSRLSEPQAVGPMKHHFCQSWREVFFEYVMLRIRLLRCCMQCRDEGRSIENKDRWISDQSSSLLHLAAVPSSFVVRRSDRTHSPSARNARPDLVDSTELGMKKDDILPRPTLAFDPVNRRHLGATPACRGARAANGGRVAVARTATATTDPRPSLFRRGLHMRKRSCAGPTCARLGLLVAAVAQSSCWAHGRVAGVPSARRPRCHRIPSLSLLSFAAGSFIFMDTVPFALAGVSGTARSPPRTRRHRRPTGRSDRPIFFTHAHDPPRRSKLEGLPRTNVAASDVSAAAAAAAAAAVAVAVAVVLAGPRVGLPCHSWSSCMRRRRRRPRSCQFWMESVEI